MIYLPSIPWYAVRPGTVILDAGGVPRTVVGNWPDAGVPGGRGLVLLEGDPNPRYVQPDMLITPIELGAADAIVEFFTAGLNPVPIPENGDQT